MQTLQRHPEKHVFGVVDRSEVADRILAEVKRVGVAEDEVQIIAPQLDEDPPTPGHGPLEGMTRVATMISEEHEFNELYQSQVEAGHCLVGIPTSGAIDKETAQDILHRHGAHFINYYGPWVVEELEV